MPRFELAEQDGSKRSELLNTAQCVVIRSSDPKVCERKKGCVRFYGDTSIKVKGVCLAYRFM